MTQETASGIDFSTKNILNNMTQTLTKDMANDIARTTAVTLNQDAINAYNSNNSKEEPNSIPVQNASGTTEPYKTSPDGSNSGSASGASCNSAESITRLVDLWLSGNKTDSLKDFKQWFANQKWDDQTLGDVNKALDTFGKNPNNSNSINDFLGSLKANLVELPNQGGASGSQNSAAQYEPGRTYSTNPVTPQTPMPEPASGNPGSIPSSGDADVLRKLPSGEQAAFLDNLLDTAGKVGQVGKDGVVHAPVTQQFRDVIHQLSDTDRNALITNLKSSRPDLVSAIKDVPALLKEY